MSVRQAIRPVFAALGSLGITGLLVVSSATGASAHVVPATKVAIACESVSFEYSAFPAGTATLTIAVTQAGETTTHTATIDEPAGTVNVPLELTGNGPVEATISWDADGGGSTFAEGNIDCTPEVVPEVVPPVVPELVPPVIVTAPEVPVAVLDAAVATATPTAPKVPVTTPTGLAFTGPREVTAEVLAGVLLLAAGFALLRRSGVRRVAGLNR